VKKILISGAGGDVGAGISKCILSGMPDATLFSCDIKEIVPFITSYETHFIIPGYDSADYWPAIKSICMDYGITHFFPTTEPEILLASKHRDFFIEKHIKSIINNNKILEIATSKYKTANFLHENGITVPATYLPGNLPDILKFPLIIKPDFGRGSMNLIKVNNQLELKKAIQTIPSPVIQNYIGTEEQEYTVGVFSDGQSVHSIAFRRKLGRGSMSVFVEVVKDTKLDKIAFDVAQLFKLKGALNIQLRLHQDDYYIFEINPRISSTAAFRHQLGFQDVVWWLRLVSEEPINPGFDIIPGIVGIKVDSEQIFSLPANIVRIYNSLIE
jgi:carbamoyl-phosphate synthase large subunit